MQESIDKLTEIINAKENSRIDRIRKLVEK